MAFVPLSPLSLPSLVPYYLLSSYYMPGYVTVSKAAVGLGFGAPSKLAYTET